MEVICIGKIKQNYIVFRHDIPPEEVDIDEIQDFGQHIYADPIITATFGDQDEETDT